MAEPTAAMTQPFTDCCSAMKNHLAAKVEGDDRGEGVLDNHGTVLSRAFGVARLVLDVEVDDVLALFSVGDVAVSRSVGVDLATLGGAEIVVASGEGVTGEVLGLFLAVKGEVNLGGGLGGSAELCHDHAVLSAPM